MTPGREEARERDRRHVWHTWSPVDADRTELMLSHGEGCRVWDVDGREYVDASMLNATCGYAHPYVVSAVADQLLRLAGADMSVSSHEPAGLLAERIASYLPRTLSRSLFVNSGSEGFEAAVTIAAGYWANGGQPRSRIVACARGYHGATLISRSLSALPRVAHPFHAPLQVTHVELPAAPRELRAPASLPPLLSAFENALSDDRAGPAMAVVIEPFLNVGGGVVLPPGFLRGLRALCDAAGTLLIVDEVFTGYGRTGRMFACEHEDVEPDILVSGKGLASGYVPISAVTVRQHVYDSFTQEPLIGGLLYGHTTSGHAAACAAALATLDVIEKEGLVERAQSVGSALLQRLSPLVEARNVVDVRGFGLVLVVEMESEADVARVTARARENGLLLRRKEAAFMVVPPLMVGDEDVAEIIERLERSLTSEVSTSRLRRDNPSVEKADITPELVSRLVARQFPEWSGLPVVPVEHDGWDNTTFRLGTDKLVRLPSSGWYVEQVDKEHRWLPVLAEQLPLPIPEPLAKGEPGEGFPRPWSVYRWLDGELATIDRVPDLGGFASDLAGFLTKLFAIDPTGGPPPGRHNFFRGADVGTYDAETRGAIEALAHEIDPGAVTEVWEAALAARWQGPPVWFHGDVAPSNLLVVDGRLAGVIDFGCSGVGDPACDLTIAWTFFHGPSRESFRNGVPVDDATWARARGWALWKALITLRSALQEGPAAAAAAARRYGWRYGAGDVIDELLAEHRRLERGIRHMP